MPIFRLGSSGGPSERFRANESPRGERGIEVVLFRTGVIGAVLLTICVSLSPANASIDDADLAFREGDYERSLHLYEEVLTRDPDNPAALFRSGLLLSWEDRLGEALARYDRLMRVAPGHREGSIERAKVLSWDGRLDEAVAALKKTLERYPGDRQAQLSLARCHAWNGDYDEARAIYLDILERDPSDTEARIGAARAEAWSGHHRAARRGYEAVLTDHPGHKDAEVGLAYLDLWQGNAAAAHRRAVDLQDRHPEDRDIGKLHQATRKAASSWVLAHFDIVDDSDENRIKTHELSAGTWIGSGVRDRGTGTGQRGRRRAGALAGDSARAKTIRGVRERPVEVDDADRSDPCSRHPEPSSRPTTGTTTTGRTARRLDPEMGSAARVVQPRHADVQ